MIIADTMHIRIYIYRERESIIYLCISVYIYIYIDIYLLHVIESFMQYVLYRAA